MSQTRSPRSSSPSRDSFKPNRAGAGRPAPVLGQVMDITVCFRVVPDVSLAREENWSTNPNVCLEGALSRVFDQFDESALETALRVKDALSLAGHGCTLRAVTLENAGQDERLYERLFALGYDRVERLKIETDDGVPALRFLPLKRAEILAGHLSRVSSDLILCGVQGSVAGSGLTGFAIGRFLDIPCLKNVSGLSVRPGGSLSAQCYEAGNVMTGTLRLPAVLLVGNTENSLLRVPTLKAKLAVRAKRAEVFRYPMPEGFREDFEINLARKPAKSRCRFPGGGAAGQAAAILGLFAGAGGGGV